MSTFHIDVTGGDRVFDLLDHFHQSPGTNKDLLLLIYLCLSLAFEGRTRVSPRGALELSRIRDNLYKTLLGQYGVFERELSPHWHGVTARHKPLRTAFALWTMLAVVVLIFTLGYTFFTFSLNRTSDATFERLASLPPSEMPTLALLEASPEPEPPPDETQPDPVPVPDVVSTAGPIEDPAPSALDNFLAFLEPQVERNLVSLSNAEGRLLVRINNAGLFEAGSAEVNDDFRNLIERIGAALAAEQFRALVVGYTDNVPIRTIQFPSNWHLSEARAQAVGDILASYTGSEAILTEGRADSNPIGNNETAEGRRANRRTEILVLTDPGERLEDALVQQSPPIENDRATSARGEEAEP